MAGFDTAVNIINDAAVELGLYSTDIADPFASTDPSVVLLIRLLKGLGQDLARDFAWTQLQAEATIATVDGQDSYALPDDFGRVIDQTQWNRSQQMPLAGPASPQEWQLLKAVDAAGAVFKIFRTKNDRVYVTPTPTSTETLKYEYVRRWWVMPDAQTEPLRDTLEESADVLWFDRRLLVAGLKLRFREARGFDTTAEERRYAEALSRAKGGDGAAPVLSITGGGGLPLLSGRNVPETGFGS